MKMGETKMSLGQKLRQERERRGIAIADIAKETCISSRHLLAIESGDTQTMPRDFFYRSFARQYAKHLGMEPREIDTAIDLEMGATATEVPKAIAMAASVDSSLPPIVTALKPKPLPAISIASAPTLRVVDQADQVSPRMFLQESRTSAPWLALAGLLLAASITYLAWDRVSGAPKPTASATNVPSSTVASSAIPSVHDRANPVSPTVTTTSANGTVVEATKLSSGGLKLIISAKEAAWIQLDADGKPLFVGLLEAGQSREVDNAQQAKLLTGNAGGIDVVQNGKQIPGLGSRGQVRTVVFNTEDYHVVQPTAAPKIESPSMGVKPDAPKSDSSPVAE